MNKSKEVLLGDNPLFGIDHLSQDRARQKLDFISSYESRVELIEYAVKKGMKGFVVSTHPQLKELIPIMEANTNLIKKLDFYPILPYAQGYVEKVTEKGIIGALNDLFGGKNKRKKIQIMLNGSFNFLKKDFTKLEQNIIDIELISLSNVHKKTIFLHDVVTDLAVGLKMKEIIRVFLNYIKDKYNAKAGLVTKNFPFLVKTLQEWDIDIPIIMTSFNQIGYQMNPNKETCEKQLENLRSEIIAMNIFAGGYLKSEQCANYISNLPIKKIVIGTSSKKHIDENMNCFGYSKVKKSLT